MPQMKKTMTETSKQPPWLRAILEAAKEQGVLLPAFTAHGMGSARSASAANGHFVTFKRRLVQADKADVDGVEWTLWHEVGGLPQPVAAFREPQHPQPENVATALSLLKGWLVDKWLADEAKAAVGRHPRCLLVEDVPPPTGWEAEPKPSHQGGEPGPLVLRIDPDDVVHLASQPGYVTYGLKECAYRTVRSPVQVFRGLKRGDRCPDELREGWVFCGTPRRAVNNAGQLTAAPDGMVFAVYADREGYVFDWDWVEQEPGRVGYPVNCDIRFGEPCAVSNARLELPAELPVPRFDWTKPCYSWRGDCIFCYVSDVPAFACRVNYDLTVFRQIGDPRKITGFKVKNVRRILEEDREIILDNDPDLLVSVEAALLATLKGDKDADVRVYQVIIEAFRMAPAPPPNVRVPKKRPQRRRATANV